MHASDLAKKIKKIIFGGLDGTVGMFAIILSGIGSDMEMKYVIIMAFSTLVATAFSMGFGDTVSGLEERK